MARLAVKSGKCVVIGLQTTGEATLKEAIDGAEISYESGTEDLPSVAETLMLRVCKLVDHPDYLGPREPRQALCERLRQQVLDLKLPPNVLDDVIDRCGGPSVVAEMTGRSVRLVRGSQGSKEFFLEKRGQDGKENIRERDAFQSGRKLIGVISDAASTGVSLHASRTVKNQRRRLHITLQLPWAADKAVQQFGRTHRSNQLTAPIYVLLMSEIGGETRFATAVASRMKKLGALTKGDRRAAGTGQKGGVEDFDIDDAIGRQALAVFLTDVMGMLRQRVPSVVPAFLEPEDPNDVIDKPKAAKFAADALEAMSRIGLVVRSPTMGTQWNRKGSAKADARFFLNRLFMIPLDLQAHIHAVFEATVSKIKSDQLRVGGVSEGIVDVAGDNFELVNRQVISLDADTKARTELITYTSDRGTSVFSHGVAV